MRDEKKNHHPHKTSINTQNRVGARVLDSLYAFPEPVNPDEFIPFMGTGEANFLGGVARARG